MIALSERLKAVRVEIRDKQNEEAAIRGKIKALLFRRPVRDGVSVSSAIVTMLDSDPGMDFTSYAIVPQIAALGFGSGAQTIRATLARLADEGRIARARRGRYCSLKRDDEP